MGMILITYAMYKCNICENGQDVSDTNICSRCGSGDSKLNWNPSADFSSVNFNDAIIDWLTDKEINGGSDNTATDACKYGR